ncbi:bifunctional homocysteine S-methyltransferase/methylenetetrahydrofolate reductase [Lactiplantibacillus sp. WILCCON 0030]|uniref:Bifunctional homocysteine S-methyltransferase/methylenetetrahydrofolate reductase n=1 Tax=Lactiplantibacillus brownii TaxID=3069269 RepID=A0ABU1A9N1_9LACO|nr:bifunctional homocysteine S-methyltransferase/methylenetetrahydrofolate reductase [Lactiplantibacillus brownii]MDQ7937143.1 bifunctional homocysteine S-methyltransferase/methylenetetrahydrofolate reductase [Lactiplantibacillus brownii]
MDLRQALKQRVLVADGAMGTLLYGNYGIASAFENLNLTHPDTILRVHQSYLSAGADVIQTNTYAANRLKLTRYDLQDQVTAINQAAVKLSTKARAAADHPAYILGTIGGLAGDTDQTVLQATPATVAASLTEQLTALLATQQLDGILLETYYELPELLAALKTVKAQTDLPVITNVSMLAPGVLRDGTTFADAVIQLAAAGADVIGTNCRLGPYYLAQSFENLAIPATVKLAVYPNSGLPGTDQDGRVVYDGEPSYFEEYAERFRQLGLNLIGGCCGTTPLHTAALVRGLASRTIVPHAGQTAQPEPTPLAATIGRHTFLQKVATQKTALVELDPPKDFETTKFFKGAQRLKAAGVDGLTLSDNSLATVRIANTTIAAELKLNYGITPIVHLTTRDHNLIGLQSEIMGLHSLGIEDILAITGDPAKLGDFPGATSVGDVRSVELIKLIKQFNSGIGPTGKSLKQATDFRVAAAFNPNAYRTDVSTKSIERKISYGCDYIITQPVFDLANVDALAAALAAHQIHIPVFVGILPLVSKRHAEFLHHEVHGIRLPKSVLTRMAQAESDGNERAVGIQIAKDLIDGICARFNGVHIVTPFNRFKTVIELVDYVQAKNLTLTK